jgi:hypothetical protein
MEAREAIIHAALVKYAAGSSFDLGRLLDNPIVGYGLAGAGIGAGASLYNTLKRRPDERKGAIRRLLTALATGGAIGSAGAAGLSATGLNLPSIREAPHLLTVEPKGEPNDAARSIGVGALGAGTLAGASGLKNVQIRRQALRDALTNPQQLEKLVAPHVGTPGKRGVIPPELQAFRTDTADVGQRVTRDGASSALKHIRETLIPGARAAGEGARAGAWEEVLRSAGGDAAESAIKHSPLARLIRSPAALALAGLGVGSAHYLANRE